MKKQTIKNRVIKKKMKKTKINNDVLKINDDVLIGEDGWLFLKGGTNNPFLYFLDNNLFSKSLVDDWCDLLNARQEKLSDINYLHFFVPNKETIYMEQTGVHLPEVLGNPLSCFYHKATPEQREVFNKCLLDPTIYFRSIKDDYQLYWKTDSHWNISGCYAAYQLICSKLGIQARTDLFSRPFTEGTIAMDLGSKLAPPITETVRFYNLCKDSYRVFANELVRYKEDNNIENEIGLHVGSNVVYRNDAAPDSRKLILFGDSFSETRPQLLTGMFAETFSEVHFVWSASMDFSYIEEHSPDIVISQLAERFAPIVPSDCEFNLKDYAAKKLEGFIANRSK